MYPIVRHVDLYASHTVSRFELYKPKWQPNILDDKMGCTVNPQERDTHRHDY